MEMKWRQALTIGILVLEWEGEGAGSWGYECREAADVLRQLLPQAPPLTPDELPAQASNFNIDPTYSETRDRSYNVDFVDTRKSEL